MMSSGAWCNATSLLHTEELSSSLHDKVLRGAKVRAWHFVLRSVSFDRARWMVDEAYKAGFNTVQVNIADGVKLDKVPWQSLGDAWSKEEFKMWVVYARSRGLEIIPEVALLTHQEKFFQDNFPDLMFHSLTYAPRQEAAYTDWVSTLLDELITLLKPRAIHIGHDEVVGWNFRHQLKVLNFGESMLPAELFLADVLRIHSYLKERNVETWMWGDMLLSPDEFPSMLEKHLHGGKKGYGKALRDKLPRDIVICDWHYFDQQTDFPSLSVMQNEGFRVIGATWKKQETIRNFSRYAAMHNAYGMMATTWFHVQREEWDIVEKIIWDSGKAFKEFENIAKPSNLKIHIENAIEKNNKSGLILKD